MTIAETAPGEELPETREELSWDRLGSASRELAANILASGFVPDLVVAVARGGLIPAGAISYALGAKSVGTMNVDFYTGINTRRAAPVVLPPHLDTSALAGHIALVVDDVADTGETLRLAVELVSQHCSQVRTAVLYAKPGSMVRPDYVWCDTDLWVTFPWSALPPLSRPVG